MCRPELTAALGARDQRLLHAIASTRVAAELDSEHSVSTVLIAAAANLGPLKQRGEYQDATAFADTDALRALGAHVETGVFGARMAVTLVNDGPVTIVLD